MGILMIRSIVMKPTADYKLLLTFSTGKEGYDYTVEWKNGCDIALHELYDDSVALEETK